ncbi:MAG: class I SAM-dependent methyltransferase [Solirubrobacteraceae bacterium]
MYETRRPDEVSWYQPGPGVSLALIGEFAPARDAAIVDVGGGASNLSRRLLALGFADITVLDVSGRALDSARADLETDAARVHWLEHDLLAWSPERRYALWHDRAVFHFLIHSADQQRYADLLRSALRPGGKAIIGTFAADGPATCSGLPVARYDPDGLAAAFGAGFTTLATRREEHRTPANSLQPFTWVALERAR